MAGTITYTAALAASNPPFLFPQAGASQQQIVQNGYGGGNPGQMIVTATKVSVDMSGFTKPGYMRITNLAIDTQCIEYGPEVSSALVKYGYLKPGESAVLRLDPAVAWCIEVDPATQPGSPPPVKVGLFILED